MPEIVLGELMRFYGVWTKFAQRKGENYNTLRAPAFGKRGRPATAELCGRLGL